MVTEPPLSRFPISEAFIKDSKDVEPPEITDGRVESVDKTEDIEEPDKIVLPRVLSPDCRIIEAEPFLATLPKTSNCVSVDELKSPEIMTFIMGKKFDWAKTVDCAPTYRLPTG